jgi:methylthioribose-1-phosphate isomerase
VSQAQLQPLSPAASPPQPIAEGQRRILTHSNTGRLATGGDGTALAAIYAKHAAGELNEVIAYGDRLVAPRDAAVWNPAFGLTLSGRAEAAR